MDWDVGTEIPLSVSVIDRTTGFGLTGQADHISLWVQRFSDGLYWTGVDWGAATPLALSEVDADGMPGLYRYVLPATANATADLYAVRGRIAAPTVSEESYEEHVSRVSPGQSAGLRRVTIRLQDDQAVPGRVGGAVVQVWTGTTFLHEHRSDPTTGELVVDLDDGTYQLRIGPPAGYSVTVPETLVVDGDATHTITLVKSTTVPPTDPTLCRLSGRLLDASGTPLGGVRLRFAAAVPQAANGDTLGGKQVIVTTDAAGGLTADLVRGARVTVTCAEAGLERVTKTVPDTATHDFETWP